jgi:hypothetical protein
MTQTYRVYGHSNKSDPDFVNEVAIRRYIGGEIFRRELGRHQFRKLPFANIFVLSRDGYAYGHFEIDRCEEPTDIDFKSYPQTKRVFIVKQSTLYRERIRLNDFGIRVGHAGVDISRETFETLLAHAGGIEEFTPPLVRFCRICFNSNGWRRPTHSADETGVSYYSKNRFGYEEWLFNYEWCLDGYKYGFLQPFHRHPKSFEGQTLSVVLYTKFAGRAFLAATIDSVFIPRANELKKVFRQMKAKKWIEQMRQDVRAIGGNVDALNHDNPDWTINVRFRPEDVTIHDPMPEFSQNSKPSSAPRYIALRPDGIELPKPATPNRRFAANDTSYLRAGQQATIVDPAHLRLQSRLYESLCQKHGEFAVEREKDFVDLQVTVDNQITFFEIKTDTSAKRCTRNALGQLFEYATFPDVVKARQWVVVGDAPAMPHDIKYLQHLRQHFQIPIFYAKFDWETGTLSPLI